MPVLLLTLMYAPLMGYLVFYFKDKRRAMLIKKKALYYMSGDREATELADRGRLLSNHNAVLRENGSDTS